MKLSEAIQFIQDQIDEENKNFMAYLNKDYSVDSDWVDCFENEHETIIEMLENFLNLLEDIERVD